MKIQLVSFFNSGRVQKYPAKHSLGMVRLAAYILEKRPEYQVALSSFPLDAPCESITGELLAAKVDIVALPGYIHTFEKSKVVCSMLEKNDDNILVVCGGPVVTALLGQPWSPRMLFVAGPGEEPLISICDQKAGSHGFSGRDLTRETGGQVYSQKSHSPDDIRQSIMRNGRTSPHHGMPLFSKQFLERIPCDDSKPGIWYETSRGCIYKCAFCGHGLTTPTPQNFDEKFIETEITNIGLMGIKKVFIVDPILGGNRARGKKVMCLFRDRAPGVACSAYMRPEFLDDEYVNILAESNIDELHIGIQSLNPGIPKSIRSNNLDMIQRWLPKLSSAVVPWRAELIVGLPGDTSEGLRDSIRFVVDILRPKYMYCYHLTILPGTQLERLLNRTDGGIWVKKLDTTNRITESSSYGKDELERMLIYSTAMSSLYNAICDSNGNSSSGISGFASLEALATGYIRGASKDELRMLREQRMDEYTEMWKGRI